MMVGSQDKSMGVGITEVEMQEEGLPWPSSGGKLQASSCSKPAGSITGPGTKILHPPRRSQKQEKKTRSSQGIYRSG